MGEYFRLSARVYDCFSPVTLFRRGLRTVATLYHNRSGVAAVEFALIAPVIFVLALGAIEIREAVSADRKLNITATTIGDLVSRTPVLRERDIADMFNVVEGIMQRYGGNEIGIIISAANIDEDGNSEVVWSEARNENGSTLATAHAERSSLNNVVDPALRTTQGISNGSTQMIVVEVFMTYEAVPDFIGLNFLNNGPEIMQLDLSDHAFNLPRLSTRTWLCPDNWNEAEGFGRCRG